MADVDGAGVHQTGVKNTQSTLGDITPIEYWGLRYEISGRIAGRPAGHRGEGSKKYSEF
jgi:hypothetical protein